jgi:hypothetical protein
MTLKIAFFIALVIFVALWLYFDENIDLNG